MKDTTTRHLARILRPHWLPMTGALVAVVFETLADVLEPWPLAIVVDHVIGGRPLPHYLGPVVGRLFERSAQRLVHRSAATG